MQKRIEFRIDAEEKELFQKAAALCDLSLSDWMREACKAECRSMGITKGEVVKPAPKVATQVASPAPKETMQITTVKKAGLDIKVPVVATPDDGLPRGGIFASCARLNPEQFKK